MPAKSVLQPPLASMNSHDDVNPVFFGVNQTRELVVPSTSFSATSNCIWTYNPSRNV